MASEPPEEVIIIPPYLEEIPLPGEEPDRAFQTSAGRCYRVKVRVTNRTTVRPPAGVTLEMAAPTGYTLTISLSKLDGENNVEMVGGKYLIFDRHEVLITHDQLSNPDFNLEATLDDVIEQLARQADAIVEKQAETINFLESAWGITL